MIHEKDGNVTEAAKIMQELQVETYGSMERKEKVEIILEQMRLCGCSKLYQGSYYFQENLNQVI